MLNFELLKDVSKGGGKVYPGVRLQRSESASKVSLKDSVHTFGTSTTSSMIEIGWPWASR
jgi:hypothetical protein